MFEFTSKLKTITIILMLIGVISVVYSFLSVGNVEGVASSAGEKAKVEAEAAKTPGHEEGVAIHHEERDVPNFTYHKTSSRATPEYNQYYTRQEHAEHNPEEMQHQLENKPWANLMLNNFFFLVVALGALFFMAVQYAAQVGWSVVVLRVMEGMSQYIIVPLVIMLGIVLFGLYGHSNHIWHWMQEGIMNKDAGNYDTIIAGKGFYLNKTFYLIRTILYLIIWGGAAVYLRKLSLEMDQNAANGAKLWKRMRVFSIVFLVLYGFTSVTMAWDWLMSIDTHWYSTLYGWYVFAGTFVSALTVLTLLVIWLRDKGYLPFVNNSHLQDLGKFMFAFSIFWTYLWFAQYLLQWYAQEPEEVTYFITRFGEYKGLFFTMLVLNFVFPILVLMSRDSKRNKGFVIFAGIMMIIGHWLDFYIMIMPGSVGGQWTIGLVEIGTFLGFAGLFLFVVFSSLAKAPFAPKNHPMLKESEYFHI